MHDHSFVSCGTLMIFCLECTRVQPCTALWRRSTVNLSSAFSMRSRCGWLAFSIPVPASSAAGCAALCFSFEPAAVADGCIPVHLAPTRHGPREFLSAAKKRRLPRSPFGFRRAVTETVVFFLGAENMFPTASGFFHSSSRFLNFPFQARRG